ncbi:MAG: RNA polymerase sigma factor [Actinobacteria bacterium]|nr:MAG: RNA polymerase sigma factor [Actinomycetota bacterium]
MVAPAARSIAARSRSLSKIRSRPYTFGPWTPPFLQVVHDEPVRVSDANELVEEVYRQHAAKLWRALVAYSGDPEVASDAVAEAFAQALRRGAAVRDAERWIWKVAFRVAAGELKDRKLRTTQIQESSYQLPEEAIAMMSLLKRLSPKQRAAVVLHYFADLPNTAIAEVLDVKTATVRVHLSQGRKRLRHLLEEDDA